MSLSETTASISKSLQHRRYWVISLGILLLFFVVFHISRPENLSTIVPSFHFGTQTGGVVTASTNSTLGFQKIFALSTGTSWRLDGLHAAANLTGLTIEIPSQEPATPEEVVEFQNISNGYTQAPGEGDARAWMAHLKLLQHVLATGLTTAFIIEDDVDWDVALRDKIMQPLTEGVRYYTNATENDRTTPFGDKWDLLWMGHCGEWSHADMPYHAWPDETVVPIDEYVGWAAVDMKERPLPEGMRTTHPTTTSVCTFAYGVTALGAQKVLDHVYGGGEAYDVVLSEACRVKKLNCVTIHPEVFHQYQPPSEWGETSEIALENEGQEIPKEYPQKMGSTPNVRNSSRCAALFQSRCQQLP